MSHPSLFSPQTPPLSPPPLLAWLAALRQPALALAWSLAEWEQVVRLARGLRLLARLAEAIDAAGLTDQVPALARRHLLAEQRLSRARIAAVCWTIDGLSAVLGDTPYPKVLLKGAAYIGQDLDIARGRLPSDLDVLVPKRHIEDAQRRLMAAGWTEPELDAHDRRYYHEWGHEVPPMTHPMFQLELDLHHNILPPVGHAPVDAGRLLTCLSPSRFSGWQVLDPVDQVLHSAAHLFFDAELLDRVRDLVDLDGLMRHFGREPTFWDRLPARAVELGLAEPLALALHFATAWLVTPVPAQAERLIQQHGPGALQRAWLVPLMHAALLPAAPHLRPATGKTLAAKALLLRHHFRRLPLRLLLLHAWHKWRQALRPVDADREMPPPTP